MCLAVTPLHLLIIEDDPVDVELLLLALEGAGCKVTSRTVCTPETLRQALDEETFDAILSDHRMPAFSGLEALSVVRQARLDVPFFLITGAIGEEAAVEYMKAGAHDFLLKGNLSRLVPALQREVQEAQNRRRQREAEERYRLIVENTAEGVWMLDDELRFTFANRRVGELLGIEPTELLGRSVLDFLDPSAREEAVERWGPAEVSPSVLDITLHGAQGLHVQALVGGTPMPGRGVLGMVTDISERRWLEQRLLESEVEKKAFCRSILRAVTHGRLRLVEREEIPPLGTPALEIRLDAWNSYARLRANLAELAVYEGFSQEGAQDLVMAVGEATTNAIKHARGGLCQASVGHDRLVVRVSDEGGGINPDELPRILENSQQVSLGMGFSLILQLADAVWLASGPSGTVVQIEVKRARVVEQAPGRWPLSDLLSVL